MFATAVIKGTSGTVARTTVDAVVKDLKLSLDIDPTAYIDMENIYTNNTYQSGINTISDNNRIEQSSNERIEVKIVEDKLSDYVVGLSHDKLKPLFKNRHLAISTVFRPMTMKVSIIYHSKSKVNVDRTIASLSEYLVTKGGGYVHMVNSYYLIPKSVLGLLENVYTTARVLVPDDKNFVEYVLGDSNVAKSLTLGSNINGSVSGLVSLLQTKIHGTFDMDIKDLKSELDKTNNTYTVELSYKFEYNKPERLGLEYDIIINNSYLPERYYKERYITDIDTRRYTDEMFDDKYTLHDIPKQYVCIPPFDNHKPIDHISISIKPFLSVLCMINADDRKNLFYLNELVYYDFVDEVMDYMTNNREGLLDGLQKGYDSIFLLDLYRGESLLHRTNLTVSEDLLVSAVNDLELTGVYRVVISMVVDNNELSPKGRSSIKDLNPEVYSTLLSSVNGDLVDHRIADSVLSNPMIPVDSISRKTVQVSTVKTFFKEKGE